MTTSIHSLPAPPQASDFTPLTEHQSTTPSTFFGARPILHYTLGHSDLLVSKREISSRSWLRECFSSAPNEATNGIPDAAEEGEDDNMEGGIEGFAVISGVTGFITSESLILFTTAQRQALNIPYPSISLHATQRLMQSTSSSPRTYHTLGASSSNTATHETQAIYLQLEPSNPNERDPALDEDESETIELFLVPQESTSSQTSSIDTATNGDGHMGNNSEQVRDIFEALSRCADLHPDAGMGGDEDEEGSGQVGGLAAALGFGGVGGGGWITAENAHEYEGQFGGEGDVDEDEDEDVMDEEAVEGDAVLGSEGLGPGAGTRRPREEHTIDGDGGGAGAIDETKWQRTD